MITAERKAAARLTLDGTARSRLDWRAFSAAYFPRSRRHDLRAIAAYGAYRRSSAADERPASEATRFERAATPNEAVSVESWEDEGGASLQAAWS